MTKSGKPSKVSTEKKPFKSYNKLNWLFNLDDDTRIAFIERILSEDATLSQITALAKKHKVNILIKNN
jgi:hypothetical protein